jgi:hypothetical protein
VNFERAAASRTCLVIDDDLGFAMFLQRVAEGVGLHVQVLTDPTQLEDSLSVADPDVITLDMDMPGRHGLEVLRVLCAAAWGAGDYHQRNAAGVCGQQAAIRGGLSDCGRSDQAGEKGRNRGRAIRGLYVRCICCPLISDT